MHQNISPQYIWILKAASVLIESNGNIDITFFRSISGEEKDEKTDKTKTAKIAERLAKKREKLLSMKRCSGYLKRPEILETVYSVEV